MINCIFRDGLCKGTQIKSIPQFIKKPMLLLVKSDFNIKPSESPEFIYLRDLK